MAKTKKAPQKLLPIHPGEILLEDYMKPLGLSSHRLSMALHVPATRAGEIINRRRAITADMAIRLGRYLISRPVFGSTFKPRTISND